MTTLPECVRTVKSPKLPKPEEEDRLEALEEQAEVDWLAESRLMRMGVSEFDPPVTMRTGVEAFMCSPELAAFIAARRI
jgi:hypothetical protein